MKYSNILLYIRRSYIFPQAGILHLQLYHSFEDVNKLQKALLEYFHNLDKIAVFYIPTAYGRCIFFEITFSLFFEDS